MLNATVRAVKKKKKKNAMLLESRNAFSKSFKVKSSKRYHETDCVKHTNSYTKIFNVLY